MPSTLAASQRWCKGASHQEQASAAHVSGAATIGFSPRRISARRRLFSCPGWSIMPKSKLSSEPSSALNGRHED